MMAETVIKGPHGQQWTIENVRMAADAISRHSPPIGGLIGTSIADMLTDYANRLQTDEDYGERVHLIEPRYAGTMTPEGFTPAEAEREHGRREILREIASTVDEFANESYGLCAFCQAHVGGQHEPSCLWLRSQAVKE